MTKHEKLIVSAYTGYLMINVDEFMKYVSKIYGRNIFTHEMATDEFWDNLQKKVYDDFKKLCSE